MSRPRPRAAAIGLAHGHIFGMAHAVVEAGAQLVAYVPEAGPIGTAFAERHCDARAVADARAILDDPEIDLVLGAGVPAERAPLGLEVMRAGKDFLVDKPGFTTLEQLGEARRAQRETGRIYSVCYSERFENRATVRAAELARSGAIGRVLHTVGLGPHRMRPQHRPDWFFVRERYGGILTDIASHQMDQFLYFTCAEGARVTAARVANRAHPEHPGLQDFGEVMLEAESASGEGASGYVRVDWFTPEGLATWGDTRLFVVGTEGTIEVRKNIDLEGRPGGDHLFLVDAKRAQHLDCADVALPFGERLLDDVANRTETAMSQAHCFRASELALRAQALAERGTPWEAS